MCWSQLYKPFLFLCVSIIYYRYLKFYLLFRNTSKYKQKYCNNKKQSFMFTLFVKSFEIHNKYCLSKITKWLEKSLTWKNCKRRQQCSFLINESAAYHAILSSFSDVSFVSMTHLVHGMTLYTCMKSNCSTSVKVSLPPSPYFVKQVSASLGSRK